MTADPPARQPDGRPDDAADAPPDGDRSGDGPRRAPGPRGLADRAARGYGWMLAQTLGTQFVNLGAQLALGWLLFKEDFGLYALTNTLAVGAAQLHKIGLRPILIRRNRRFELWANAAFWIALWLGIGSMLLLFAIAPFADRVFGTEGLAPLIAVIALSMPFTSMSVVPEARIQAQMRFRLLAASRFAQISGQMGLTVLFAALGLGAMSFVLPRPIVAAARATWLLAVTRPPIRLAQQVRRWRLMARDAFHLTISNVNNYLTSHADYLILGLFHNEAVVGLYFYAFGLSQRAFVFLTLNLKDVIFPTLSSIQDEPRRQVVAFLRASRVLALVGTPFCVLQILLAEPAIDALLPDTWTASALVIQVLSAGTIFRVVGQPAQSLVKAQGRFGTLTALSVSMSAAFIAFVVAGAMLGEAVAVAIAVAVYMAVTGPVSMWIGVRHAGGTVADVLRVFSRPFVAGAVATLPAWLLATVLDPLPAGDWLQLVLVPLVLLSVFAAMARLVAREEWDEFAGRVRQALRRRGGGGAAKVAAAE